MEQLLDMTSSNWKDEIEEIRTLLLFEVGKLKTLRRKLAGDEEDTINSVSDDSSDKIVITRNRTCTSDLKYVSWRKLAFFSQSIPPGRSLCNRSPI